LFLIFKEDAKLKRIGSFTYNTNEKIAFQLDRIFRSLRNAMKFLIKEKKMCFISDDNLNEW